MTAVEKLETLFSQHRGLLRRKDVVKAGIHPRELSRFVDEGRAERVGRGVYRLVGHEGFDKDWLLEIAYLVPKGVVCLMSAASFHELGTFVPSETHLALPTGSHLPKLDYPPVALHQFSGELYTYGTEEHQIGCGVVKVYSPEKTLADLLRFRHQYGLGLFLEVLKAYFSGREKSTWKLLEAAKVCGVEKQMQTYATTVLA